MTPGADEPAPHVEDGRPRSRRGEGDRLREEILDAAERLLVESGDVDAVSVRAVTRAVGVTPASLYLHFADKSALVFEVCQRRFEEFDRVLADAGTSAEGDCADVLLAMGRAYVRYGLEHPEAYQVLFGLKGDVIPEGVAVEELPGMQAFFRLVSSIEAGMEAGTFRRAEPVGSAIGVWATMHGLVMLLLGGSDGHVPMPDDVVEQVCRQVLDGLRVR